MATIANLNILLTLTDQATSKLEASAKRITDIGKKLTATVTTPVLGFAAFAVKQASDLNEAKSAAETTFAEGAQQVIKWSENSAQAMGLSQEQYLSGMTVLGVYGDMLDMTGAQTADFANQQLQAAADLASFYNANTTDVLAAQQAALRGEFDPLERYGILLNQATLEQYAMEQGIWDGTGAMSQQQKIMATHAYIMDHLGAAEGDFARTQGGLANQMRILKAEFANTAATLGALLLPYVLTGAQYANRLLKGIQGLSDGMKRFVVFGALAAAALGPLLIVIGMMLPAISALGAVFGLLLGPLGLVLALIGLLGVAYLKNWFGFGDAVRGAAKHVIGFVKNLKLAYDFARKLGKSPLEAAFSSLGIVLENLTGINLNEFFDRMGNAFQRPIDAIKKVFSALSAGNWRRALSGIGDLLAAPAKLVGDVFKGIETGFKPLDRVFSELGNIITGFGRLIQEVFQGDFAGALDVARGMLGNFLDLFQNLGDLGGALFRWITDAISGINWGGLWDTVTDVTGTIVGKLGDLLSAMSTWVTDAVGDIDWVSLWDNVTDVTSTIVSKLGSLSLALATWVVTAVGDIDWGALWDNVTDVTATIIGKLGDLGAKLLTWATDAVAGIAWSGLWTGVTDVTATIIGKLGDLHEAILNWISLAIPDDWTNLWGMVTDVTSTIIGKLGDLGAAVWTWMSDAVTGAIDGVAANAETWATTLSDNLALIPAAITEIPGMDTVVNMVTEISNAITSVVTAAQTAATTMSGYMTSFVASFPLDTLQSIYEKLYGIWDTLNKLNALGYGPKEISIQDIEEGNSGYGPDVEEGPLLEDGSKRLAPFRRPVQIPPPDTVAFDRALSDLPLRVASVMASMPVIVGQAMSDALSAASTYASATGSVVGEGFGAMVGNVTGLMTGLSNAVGQGMSNSLSAAATYSTAIYSVVSEQFGQLVGNVSALVNTIPGIVTGAMNATANSGGAAAYNAGLSIGAGLANGMAAMQGQVEQAAANLAFAATNAANLALGVASPSRVFMEIGEHVGDGLAIGMRNRLSAISAASGAMAAAAGIGLDGGGSGVGGGVTYNQNNYGVINEADPFWTPDQTLLSQNVRRGRR